MILLFDIWFPLIKGFLLIFLAVEQLYLFRFVYAGYQIVKDRSLLFIASAFLAFSIGSIASSFISISAFTYLSDGAIQESSQLLGAGDALLSIFEIAGFSIFLTLPSLARRSTTADLFLITPFVIGLNNYLQAVNLIVFILIVVFLVYVFQNTGSLASLRMNTIMGGLFMLAASKIIAFIPIQPYSLGTLAIILEVIAFSTFIFLREIISVTFTVKPPPSKGSGKGEV